MGKEVITSMSIKLSVRYLQDIPQAGTRLGLECGSGLRQQRGEGYNPAVWAERVRRPEMETWVPQLLRDDHCRKQRMGMAERLGVRVRRAQTWGH